MGKKLEQLDSTNQGQPHFCYHCRHGFLKLPNNGQTQGLVSRIDSWLPFPKFFFSSFCCAEILFWKWSNFSPSLKKQWSTLSTSNKMLHTKIVMKIACVIEKLFIIIKLVIWYVKRSNLEFTMYRVQTDVLAQIQDLQF